MSEGAFVCGIYPKIFLGLTISQFYPMVLSFYQFAGSLPMIVVVASICFSPYFCRCHGVVPIVNFPLHTASIGYARSRADGGRGPEGWDWFSGEFTAKKAVFP